MESLTNSKSSPPASDSRARSKVSQESKFQSSTATTRVKGLWTSTRPTCVPFCIPTLASRKYSNSPHSTIPFYNNFPRVMDLIEIKPSTTLHFSLPDSLSLSFTLYNITLHQLHLRLYSTHPSNFIITPNRFIMDSFDERTIKVQIRYFQESAVSNFLANKMILYLYDFDQEGELWSSEGITPEKFKKVHKVEFQLSCTANMQKYCLKQPIKKDLMVRMSRLSEGQVTQLDKVGIVDYLESLGNLSSFHTLPGDVFLARYKSLNQTPSEIREVESEKGMVLYAVEVHPWMVFPSEEVEELAKEKEAENVSKSSKSLQSKPSKQFSTSSCEDRKDKYPKEHSDPAKEEQGQRERMFSEERPFREGIRVEESESLVPRDEDLDSLVILPAKKPVLPSLQHLLTEDGKATAATLPKPRNNNAFESFVSKNPKGSFSKRATKRRNKSVQIKVRKGSSDILEEEEDDEEYEKMFMQPEFSRKPKPQAPPLIAPKPHLQNVQIINCIIKPLNLLLLPEGGLYILFEGFVMLYPSLEKIGAGERTDLGPMPSWCQKKTVMKCTGDYLVVSCNSVFFVLNISTKKCYNAFVQRKEILDFLIHPKEDILLFAGKTFSKLSLFGKQTARSNIKTYSISTQYHLYTFDLPQAGDIYHCGEFGESGSDIVVSLGNDNHVSTLYFLKIISPTKLEVLSRFDLEELAVAEVKELCFWDKSIFVLEDMLNEEAHLMFVKKLNIKFDDRPSISTESLPIPHGSYSSLTMDQKVLVMKDLLNKRLVVFDFAKRKFVWVHFEGEVSNIQVRYPYLSLIYETHIEVKRLANVEIA